MDVNLVPHTEGRKHTLTVFANRVLRKIFGPKREDVKGYWRSLTIATAHRI